MKNQNFESNKPELNLKKVWLLIGLVFVVNLIVSYVLWSQQNSHITVVKKALVDYKVDQRQITSNLNNNLAIINDRLDSLTNSITAKENVSDDLEIRDGSVYYTNAKGEELKIAEAVNDPDPQKVTSNLEYVKALTSPNGKFIVLVARGWEWHIVSVYDMNSGQANMADFHGSEVEWLKDNRLKVYGDCGMGSSCGTYESADNNKPWVMKKVDKAVDENL